MTWLNVSYHSIGVFITFLIQCILSLFLLNSLVGFSKPHFVHIFVLINIIFVRISNLRCWSPRSRANRRPSVLETDVQSRYTTGQY